MSSVYNTHDFAYLNEFIQIPARRKHSLQNNASEEIYKKNIDVLKIHHPELLDMLDSTFIDDNRIRICQSEGGKPRIIYRTEDGQEINIHGTDDPVKCAKSAIDLLGNIEKEGIIVLFGFGLGYFAEEIFKNFEKGHILLIYEATPEIFKLALRIKDFTGILRSDRVKIVLGKDSDNFSVIHHYHQHIMNGKFWAVRHEPSVKLNSEAYDYFLKRLKEEQSLTKMGAATNVRRGREFMDACFWNVHSIIRKPGVKELKDIFKGCVAIVVSAGPSLDKNVHLLRKLKGKAVIIASGGSLLTLLSCDIVPDVIVDIDPVKENMEDKFQDNPELKNVPFVCLDQYTPELVDMYPGPLFINTMPSNYASAWLKNYWGDKGSIECFGGSVAHLAFATAEYIGADIIAFVGQDLSYKTDRIHTAGYSDDLDRKLKNAKGKHESVIGEIPVRDVFDEVVYSIPQFITFKTSFENRIRMSGRTVINATEGGLPIEGATNMRLMDFMDEYCEYRNETDAFSVLSGRNNKEMHCNIDDLINEVTLIKKKYESIKRASRQILNYMAVVNKFNSRDKKESPELNRILSKVRKLVEKVKHPSLNLLAGYNYGLELYMKKQEIQDIDEIDDAWEMLDKQIERGRVYYNEIVKTITLFNKSMERVITALKREKKIESILTDNAIEERERFYRAGKMYKEAGLAARAAEYLETLVNAYGNHSQKEPDTDYELPLGKAYILLAEVYIRQFRYYDAKATLVKVRNWRGTYSGKADELLTVCNRKIRAWEGKKKETRAFLKESEQHYGSHLESGYFYFRIKDFERAKESYSKAISSQGSGGNDQELSAAYYGLAHTYLAMNDPESAVSSLESAIAVDPANPLLYRDLGLVALENQNMEPAEIFLLKAIELVPNNVEFYKPLFNLYMSLGKTEKAVALYESAIKENADISAIQHDLALTYNSIIGNTGT